MPAFNKTIATGIRKKYKRGGYEAYITVRGKLKSKMFPPTASRASMERWRMEQFAAAECAEVVTSKLPSLFPASPNGFCYLYIVRAGMRLKIGRAANIRQRMSELQTGSPDKLELLAAAPIHASVELLIHERFKHHHITGEWFDMGLDILHFAKWLQSDRNPLVYLWPGSQAHVEVALEPRLENINLDQQNQAI